METKFKASRPKMLFCHLCGREFGTMSLPIHLKACEEKHHDPKAGKNKDKAKAAAATVAREAFEAVMSGRMSENEYNDLAFKAHQGALEPCEVCGRTFSKDALQRHANACKPGGLFDPRGKDGARASRPASPQREPARASIDREEESQPRSKLLLCPYCGREYGSLSLPIHLKTCMTKHRDKDVPAEIVEAVLSGHMDQAAYNEWAAGSYKANLLPCEVCGRTFTESALRHHEKACTPGGLFDAGGARSRPASPTRASGTGGARPSSPSRQQQPEEPALNKDHLHDNLAPKANPNFLLCPYCGRNYGSASLTIHIQTCQTKNADKKISKEVVDKVLSGEMSQQEYNDHAFENYKANLLPCGVCGRRFTAEALEHHRNSCRPGGLFDKKDAKDSARPASRSPKR